VNVAVTVLAALKVTLQFVMPVQSPDHPPNEFAPVGVSMRVTTVFGLKVDVHVPGQLIPEGLLVTVPEPVPVTVTAN